MALFTFKHYVPYQERKDVPVSEDKGFVALTWLDSGARSFYTKDKAIRTPADLAGLKIRTMDSLLRQDGYVGGFTMPSSSAAAAAEKAE